ncbi:MAG: NINE protein [Gemmatimonadetes bacterium]|nr:NINE protein [Gemmatimonadota bacterium]NNM06591.1 NINE protein [Gemmatimonadota bacterium]
MADTALCPFCESELSPTVKKCKYCGEWVSRECQKCGTPIRGEWAATGVCAACGEQGSPGVPVHSPGGHPPAPTYPVPHKSRPASVLLAMLFGGLGAHKFYLDRPGLGFLYLLFFWTLIPSIAGVVEGIIYMTHTEEEFQERFRQGRI